MRQLLTAGMLALAMAACSKSPEKAPDRVEEDQFTTVTVMTYNIWGARSGGIPALAPLAAVINQVKPDLVALQEVDKNTSRNAPHGDIAKKLGELTGMHSFFAKAINTSGGEYGEAILSRLPFQETKAYTLGVTPELGGELRAIARVKVEKEGIPFYFIGTHLDHLSNEANRIKQANETVALLQTFELPMIVGGDLNAVPTSETIRILRTFLSTGCINFQCDQQPTFSTSNPNRTIDYLMYARVNDITPQSYYVLESAYRESDHFPVVATFRIKKKKND